MKTFFLNRPPYDMESWNIFERLAAIIGIYHGILYECSFIEPLTLLRDVVFDKVNVMEPFFLRSTDFRHAILGYIRQFGSYVRNSLRNSSRM